MWNQNEFLVFFRMTVREWLQYIYVYIGHINQFGFNFLLVTIIQTMVNLAESWKLVCTDKSLQWSLFASVLYGFCSGSMNFLNKAVLSVWQFHHPSMIILCQIIMLSTGLYILKACNKVTLVDYTLDRAKKLWKLSLVYCLNAVVGKCLCF